MKRRCRRLAFGVIVGLVSVVANGPALGQLVTLGFDNLEPNYFNTWRGTRIEEAGYVLDYMGYGNPLGFCQQFSPPQGYPSRTVYIGFLNDGASLSRATLQCFGAKSIELYPQLAGNSAPYTSQVKFFGMTPGCRLLTTTFEFSGPPDVVHNFEFPSEFRYINALWWYMRDGGDHQFDSIVICEEVPGQEDPYIGIPNLPPHPKSVEYSQPESAGWYDPVGANTFNYETDGSFRFTQVGMPVAIGDLDDIYTITDPDNGTVTLHGGEYYTFPSPVVEFTVSGIDPPILPTEEGLGFPTYLDFDIYRQGKFWISNGDIPENLPPVVNAGEDQNMECVCPIGAVVQLNGSGSDPDGDELSYKWEVAEGTATLADDTNAQTCGYFPIGLHLLTLTVSDGKGGVAVDDVLISVYDTTPPTVELTTDMIMLWPPNHQMVSVQVALIASDACADPTALQSCGSISCNEADDGCGDGSFTGDVDLLDGNGGQDAFARALPLQFVYDPIDNVYRTVVDMRAERNGINSGRKYSLTCVVKDASGNESIPVSCVVVVPHDKRKN